MVHPFASPPETLQTLGHLAASYFGPAALTSS